MNNAGVGTGPRILLKKLELSTASSGAAFKPSKFKRSVVIGCFVRIAHTLGAKAHGDEFRDHQSTILAEESHLVWVPKSERQI